ncbi:hypothetical protein F511_16514 [Dorcoceras hygrometricum]|uniref:Splicing factor 3B subunit 1-like n=1 Tax=Dorcoceras hygrometricum TaxID=472368 RepID=A0A2Z7CST6_9LAMI|nr:hypothetical protein F511_16514 [Dorcoceras hygrometricum]
MASSLISNTIQVYFASVLEIDNEGMVAMFEALISSGLSGFLGCSMALYDVALIEFFQNASVRDGQVISTVQGKSVEISEEVFAGTFEMLVEGLIDINEVPKDLDFDARSEFSFTGEQLATSCKKRKMKIEFRLLSDILPKRKASKRKLKLPTGSDDEIADKDAAVEEVAEKLSDKQTADVVMNEPTVETFVEKEKERSGDDVDSIIQQILADTAQFETVFEEPEVVDFEELVSSNADGITVGDTEQLVAAEGQQLQVTETEEEAASLPQIAETDKCKAPLVEESVQGHPAREIFSLICADIDFLVQLREKTIEDVSIFFNSFNLRRLPTLHEQSYFHVNSPDDEKTSTDQFDFVADTPAVGTSPAPTQTSLPPHLAQMSLPVATDVSASFAELRASISRLIANQSRALGGWVILKAQFYTNSIILKNEQLDFRAQAQENYNTLSTKLGLLVDYINRSGDAKKGEDGSSRPQRPPDDQSRPSGGSASRGSGSRGSGDGSSKSRADRGGSSNKRPSSSGGGGAPYGPYGPYKKDVEYLLFGKNQF